MSEPDLEIQAAMEEARIAYERWLQVRKLSGRSLPSSAETDLVHIVYTEYIPPADTLEREEL